MVPAWRVIPCSWKELNLDITLSCGQCFRWRKKTTGEWIGVFANIIWILKQDNDGNLNYKAHRCNTISEDEKNSQEPKKGKKKQSENKIFKENQNFESICDEYYDKTLKEYFQLEINIFDLYKEWSQKDEKFLSISKVFSGVRILQQDPTENLISFICSSNNNIPRITSMVEKLCLKFGNEGLEIDGEMLYTFPSLERLANDDVEQKLRKMGFGYRAKYIHQTAAHITQKCPRNWLTSLKSYSYEEARKELMQLSGVGGKVADCICLMSLGKCEAVPVDTHVWQIAVRDYLPHLKSRKSMTDKVYWEIGNFFRDRFGKYAGWAHSVLFAADLPQFKHLKN